jgi:hypothetical protein
MRSTLSLYRVSDLEDILVQSLTAQQGIKRRRQPYKFQIINAKQQYHFLAIATIIEMDLLSKDNKDIKRYHVNIHITRKQTP